MPGAYEWRLRLGFGRSVDWHEMVRIGRSGWEAKGRSGRWADRCARVGSGARSSATVATRRKECRSGGRESWPGRPVTLAYLSDFGAGRYLAG